VDRQGNVYFTDIPNNRIHKIEHATGKVTVFKEDTGGANGLMFGPDGRLYACQSGRKRIVPIPPTAPRPSSPPTSSRTTWRSTPAASVVHRPVNKRVWFVDAQGAKRVVHEGLQFANGVVLSP